MNKKAALFTVFLVVLVDLIGFGIVLPNLALYARELHATPFFIGFLYSIYSIAQLVFSPIWGSLSDKWGRRPILMTSTFGACLAYLFFAFSHTLWMLFLARLFAGIMAGNISTAQAYVADVTTPEDRAKGMGLIGAAFGIGFVLGPAIGAGLMHLSFSGNFFQENHYAPLGFFAAGLSALSFCLVVLKLPESIGEAAKNDAKRIVKTGVLSAAFWKNIRTETRAGKAALPVLLFSAFILAFGQSSIYGAFPLFCKAKLALSPGQIGMEYVWMGLVAVVIQGGLIKTLEKKFGEKTLFFTGNLLMTLGLGAIPFAGSVGALTAVLVLMSVGGSLNGPTLLSLLSKQSDPGQYGAMMGTTQGLAALGRAVGPSWGGWLFGLAPQAPFLATALVVSATILVGFRLKNAK